MQDLRIGAGDEFSRPRIYDLRIGAVTHYATPPGPPWQDPETPEVGDTWCYVVVNDGVAAIDDLTIEVQAGDVIVLTWTPKAGDTKYRIYRSKNGNPPKFKLGPGEHASTSECATITAGPPPNAFGLVFRSSNTLTLYPFPDPAAQDVFDDANPIRDITYSGATSEGSLVLVGKAGYTTAWGLYIQSSPPLREIETTTGVVTDLRTMPSWISLLDIDPVNRRVLWATQNHPQIWVGNMDDANDDKQIEVSGNFDYGGCFLANGDILVFNSFLGELASWDPTATTKTALWAVGNTADDSTWLRVDEAAGYVYVGQYSTIARYNLADGAGLVTSPGIGIHVPNQFALDAASASVIKPTDNRNIWRYTDALVSTGENWYNSFANFGQTTVALL